MARGGRSNLRNLNMINIVGVTPGERGRLGRKNQKKKTFCPQYQLSSLLSSSRGFSGGGDMVHNYPDAGKHTPEASQVAWPGRPL